MPLKSAYRFVPIGRWVYTPAWGPYASHDVPLKGAVSGEMKIKIITLTETCLGGARNGTEVQPFKMHTDGAFAIPASALDGLLRSTLEVVTFGRLGDFVEKRWPGIRDIDSEPGKTVKERYSKRMARVKAGWLLNSGETVKLIPCDLDRLDIRKVKKHFGIREQTVEWDQLAAGDNTAPDRYRLLGFDGDRPFDDKFSISMDHAHNQGKAAKERLVIRKGGPIDATLVVTGKPKADGNPYGKGKKKREFLFSNPSRRELIADPAGYPEHRNFPEETFAAFKYLTSRSHGGRAHAGWTFWEPFFCDKGEPVPVFYIEEDNAVAAMGMAQMFKAAFGANTHDLLINSSTEHLTEPSVDRLPDFPSTLLGEAALYATDDDGAKTTGRAGRITFTLARVLKIDGAPEVKLTSHPYTLSSPKEGYYPLYVRQDEYSPSGGGDGGKPMATFSNVTDAREQREFVKKPELAGTKIWPAGDGKTREQDRDKDQGHNEDSAAGTAVSFLPAGTEFEGRIVFHNVLPQELGAVIWALTAGGEGNQKPILRLGTAKAYGHGEVEIELAGLTIAVGEIADLETACDAFADHMDEVVKASGLDGAWEQTKQVQAILESRKRSGLALGVMDTETHAKERHAQSLIAPFPSQGVEFEKGKQLRTTPPVVEPELDEVPPAGAAVTVRRGATGSHAVRIGQAGIVGPKPLTKQKALKIFFGNEKQPISVPFKDLRLL